ncbi:NPL4 family-domain-containing protein [Spinellus fusiger]|nr:NPL4 family-domain-containing protein [Spinellus fusiger]
MLLRIRSKDGMVRVQVDPTDTFGTLAVKVGAELKVDALSLSFGTTPNPSTMTHLSAMKEQTLASAQLQTQTWNMVFVLYDSPTTADSVSSTPLPPPESQPHQANVDTFLEKQSGFIKRPKDSKFCRHGDHAMCDYCMPLEPYDQSYLEENKIKHMSFHSYLRQRSATQQTKTPSAGVHQQLPLLEEFHCKVKVPCTGAHAPWPEGICTKCQPSAITLQQQIYRMVDHVEFSSASLIDHFLDAWRSTGCQRFGYLYGRYEPYLEVPLGIKAVVEVIVEPDQEDHVDGISLQPWEKEQDIDTVVGVCGLVKLGMVFTDLVDNGSGTGKVIPKRHVDSHFLSSQECLFAAEMQRRHPNLTRHSATGHFGSKFVSCVISGDLEGNVDVMAYQVSNSLVAMEEAGIVEASRKPSVMRVKESVPHERYVPEVFYKYKNSYGVLVKSSAKPTFPVEYLLVNVTHGFPHIPSPLFRTTHQGRLDQNLVALAHHLEDHLSEKVSNFHVLTAIHSTHVLSPSEFQLLCAVATHPEQGMEDLENTPGWKTLQLALKEAQGSANYLEKGGALPIETKQISCRHCTFTNAGNEENCEMCGLPLADA